MRAVRRCITACVLSMVAGCSLFVSLDDLQNGGAGASDASDDAHDANVSDAKSDAFAGDASADAGCPSGGGPSMVSLSYGYCIDSTEVSQSQYQAFIDAITAGYTPPTPPRCDWNLTYGLPSDAWCVTNPDDPVACANWCDAYAFCQWAGKHLCGATIGGALPGIADAVDSNTSAWAKACSSNGANSYPYGSTYEPVCNELSPDGGGVDLDATLPVGSEAMCEGPPGVFDLIGNASEWIDACDLEDAGATDNCAHLGGAASDLASKTCLQLDGDRRSFQREVGYAIGFRCCAP